MVYMNFIDNLTKLISMIVDLNHDIHVNENHTSYTLSIFAVMLSQLKSI